ncbi:hypothetical protein L5515_003850 [Caenorhabditis briggsae]|uniref:Transmembrane protein n=2 Tax=Caenorhabditis briggsae TaxID=6238 RepID=A0AAE9EFX1_CAEBR|nr:hypothetical protein L5515_003850 [Caenorhabditis briggsae]
MSELTLVDFGSRTPTLRQTASRRRRPLKMLTIASISIRSYPFSSSTMNVYSVFVFAVLAISSVSGIINIGGGKKCGRGGNGYGSGIIIGAPKPGGK